MTPPAIEGTPPLVPPRKRRPGTPMRFLASHSWAGKNPLCRGSGGNYIKSHSTKISRTLSIFGVSGTFLRFVIFVFFKKQNNFKKSICGSIVLAVEKKTISSVETFSDMIFTGLFKVEQYFENENIPSDTQLANPDLDFALFASSSLFLRLH